MTRHVVKLSLLLLGLAFLAWWGWSGNFDFNQGSFFQLADQERFFRVHLGEFPVGFARREVATAPGEGSVSISEEIVFDLSFGGDGLRFKTFSTTVFDGRGRLVSADFSLPLGSIAASATARAAGGSLVCRFSLGETSREATLPLPALGPVVASGIVPWLGRQRELPLGRPMEVELLDPVSMTFSPASLTIEDDTAQSEEKQTWKLTLGFKSVQSVERVDSDGFLLSQFNPSLQAGLRLIEKEEEIGQAREALAAPVGEDDERLIGELLENALSSGSIGGLEGLSGLIGLP